VIGAVPLTFPVPGDGLTDSTRSASAAAAALPEDGPAVWPQPLIVTMTAVMVVAAAIPVSRRLGRMVRDILLKAVPLSL
jgi:hypothetical protein